MPDEILSKESQQMIAAVFRKMKGGEALAGEQELLAEVLKEHPELDEFWGTEFAIHPQEIKTAVGDQIVTPLVHVGLHLMVERQILHDEPEEVRQVTEQRTAEGKSRHEALHEVAGIFGNLYFKAVRRGQPMEEFVYIEALRALTAGRSPIPPTGWGNI